MTDRRSLEQNDLLQPACRDLAPKHSLESMLEAAAELDYEPETGVFCWKRNGRGRTKRAGAVAGSIVQGYTRIKVGGKEFYAHRLAWVMMTGKMPVGEIDHINRDRSDNRFANLREATSTQNRYNSVGRPTRRVSEYKGVSPSQNRKRWQATIQADGKYIRIGIFDTEEAAAEAYQKAARKYHGEFASC